MSERAFTITLTLVCRGETATEAVRHFDYQVVFGTAEKHYTVTDTSERELTVITSGQRMWKEIAE